MTTATQADIAYQLKNLMREFDAAGLPSAGLAVQSGSKTYGRAFRLFYEDPTTGGLAEVRGMRSSYLGMTKSEAVDALKFLIDGMRMARANR